MVLDSNWTIVSVNPAATRLYRRRTDELLSRSFFSVFAGSNEPQLREEFGAALFQHRLPRRTELFSPGLFAWHSVLVIPADAHLLLSTDVTDRARREEDEAVRASLRRIFENLPMLVCITRGREHRFDVVNAAARAVLGERVKEGERLDVALPETKEQGFTGLLDGVFDSGRRYEGKALRLDWTDSNGRQRSGYFDVVYEPLYGPSGDVVGIVHLAVEVTRHIREQERLPSAAGSKPGDSCADRPHGEQIS